MSQLCECCSQVRVNEKQEEDLFFSYFSDLQVPTVERSKLEIEPTDSIRSPGGPKDISITSFTIPWLRDILQVSQAV